MRPKCLVLEDGSSRVDLALQSLLRETEWERVTWENFKPEFLSGSSPNLILAHAIPEMEKAIAFFRWLGENPLHVPTIAVLPRSIDRGLLHTISQVADDFVLWPADDEELRLRVSRVLQPEIYERLRHELTAEIGLRALVGKHTSFVHAIKQVPLFASSNAPILITGETGTGKEVFAHAIHALSSRQSGPFIPVDCGVLPEQLAENELFGHSRGAFTDARTDRKGLIAMADKGTLFLDEVDSLSLQTQCKLLRFLQEGTYRALGSDQFVKANIRVIVATNQKMEEIVRQGRFRRDLYFRLHVLRLQLPPLRERAGDVSLLAQHFLEKQCASGGSGWKIFSPAALRKLEHYDWPGNVRELLNTVQRSYIYCPGPQILPNHIVFSDISEAEGPDLWNAENFQAAKQRAIEKFERTYIQDLLMKHGGNITQAAREAGKERRAFGKLVKKYNLNREQTTPVLQNNSNVEQLY